MEIRLSSIILGVVGIFFCLLALILLFVLLRYFPSASNNLVLTIVGNFALVFGIFSLVLAWYAAYDDERGAQA